MLKFACGSAALALMLSACGPGSSELDGNLEIIGMDPVFWGAKVDHAAKTTTITVTGARDIKGDLPVKSSGEKGATVLTVKTPDGDFVVTLSSGKCQDGLGEREYHWAAAVTWQNEVLKGCAAPL